MAEAASAAEDVVVWGVTASGRKFRPSDWAERLAGLTAAFGSQHKLVYSPLVRPIAVRGVKALVVDGKLAAAGPRLYRFLLNFARDNGLAVQRVPDALANAHSLTPPGPAPTGNEPREPV
jgi:hypothetical protein